MFSFLFSGGSKEDEARLSQIQESLRQCPSDGGNANLDSVAKCARELREVMDAEVSRGAKSHKLMQRIEDVSSEILDNLEARVTSDLVRQPGGKAAVAKILAIAADLDAVRATKASTVLQSKVDIMQEQFGKEELQKVLTAMEALKNVKLVDFVETLRKVVATIEAAHSRVPASKALANALLQRCVSLGSVLLANLPKAMLADTGSVTASRNVAESLDSIGGKMVAVMGATWDPPVKPKVDEMIAAQVAQAFSTHLAPLQAAAAAEGGDLDLSGVAPALRALEPWWPHAGEAAGASESLEALCGQLDSAAVEAFRSRVEAGDTAAADALLGWAEEYDTACAVFVGCATADKSLRAQLKASVSSGAVGQLDALDAELAKSETLVPAMGAMALQVLERLVPIWATASSADDTLSDRLTATLTALEDRAKAAVEGAGAGAVKVLRFAEKYDALKAQLLPGSADGEEGCLQKRLAPLVGGGCLRAAEAEVAKTEGLNPQVVLAALVPFRGGLVKEVVEEEDIRQRLVACLEAVEERVRQAFCGAREEADSKRLDGLRSFAEKFDAVCVDIGINERDGRRSLPQWLQLLDALINAEAEAARGSELDPEALAAALAEVTPLCATPVAIEDLAARLRALSPALRPALLGFAARGGEQEALGRCGHEADALSAVLAGSTPDGEGEICQALTAVRSMAESLNTLDSELAKESGMNPKLVLEVMEAVKAGWEPVGDVYELGKRLQHVFAVMETRMVESCEKAIAAGATKKVQALLSFARRCDQVREAAAGDARLCERIAGLIARARLVVLKAELEKEAGMNPMHVLTYLKTLSAIWPDLADHAELSELSEQVEEAAGLLSSRMQSSMDYAAKAGNKKKADALVKFGKEYDDVLVVLGANVGLCEVLAKGLLRVAGGTASDVGEDYMATELRSLETFMSAESIMEAFRKWDKNDSGTIMKEEFAVVVRSLDPRFTDDVVDALFSQADINGDGQLDYEEFIGWIFK